ncbi:MAG: hypothetical protein INQ03_16945 [Candidatus Heimdallarchaeota archaeon]|nr:hypothetical protein [Candidatus Heimdallarchaeota archaeon]
MKFDLFVCPYCENTTYTIKGGFWVCKSCGTTTYNQISYEVDEIAPQEPLGEESEVVLEVVKIRTLRCELCNHPDIVVLGITDLAAICENEDGIGNLALDHQDHIRIVYFDENGTYLKEIIV